MAKYKASPFYSVDSKDHEIQFDFNGYYETDDAKEIAILDALCPTWIKRIDSANEPKKAEEPAKEPQKGGKSSAK